MERQEEMARIDQILKNEPSRRVFGYTSIGEFSDALEEDAENRERFFAGDDQRAYNELMDVIKVNAERNSDSL